MINRNVVTHLFAFEEAQSVDVILYVFPQLFLDGFPCVAEIVHFLGTLKLHGGTSLETNERALSQSLVGWLYTWCNQAGHNTAVSFPPDFDHARLNSIVEVCLMLSRRRGV